MSFQSHVVKSLRATLFATFFFIGASPIARAAILDGVGVMGDSASIRSSSYKWPVQLQNYRSINFGGSGLPYDYAVGGATSASLLSGNQHTKMRNDVLAGKVTLGIIFIGNNDWGSTTGLQIAAGSITPTAQTAFQNAVFNNIKTAVDMQLNAGIEGMIIGGIEDLSLTPTGQSVTDVDARSRIQASISSVNSQLLAYAQTNHLPFIDFFGLANDIYDSGLVVGGVNINFNTSGSNPRNFWIDDLHPGILGNAILGNVFMTAMNVAYGTNLPLYTDQQILTLAGLSSSYTGETFSTSYNLTNYVHYSAVPETSSIALAFFGAAVLVIAARRNVRLRPEPSAS